MYGTFTGTQNILSKVLKFALCIVQDIVERKYQGAIRQFLIDDKGAVIITVFGYSFDFAF